MSNCHEADPAPAKVRQVALGLLARREHSVLELHHKLSRRGFPSLLVEAVLAQLVAEDLLNETRYAEVYALSRADKGYGPLRIQRELQERGVSDVIVSAILAGLDEDWMPKLIQLHRKRFDAVRPREMAEEARQMRFLRQRGFTLEQIKTLFKHL
jgi:regulatory protein